MIVVDVADGEKHILVQIDAEPEHRFTGAACWCRPQLLSGSQNIYTHRTLEDVTQADRFMKDMALIVVVLAVGYLLLAGGISAMKYVYHK